jgi:hypothetical protein
MASKKFKVKYATRNKLARSLQKEVRTLGLIDTGTLYDSIRISAVSGEVINELMITINAMYYYLFLDEGTSRGIPPYSITDKWLQRSDTQAIIGEIVAEYIAYQFEVYPLLDLAPILNNPKIQIQFNWIDSPYANLPTAPMTAF